MYIHTYIFDAENPDILKINHMVYIVVSTGKIKTDVSIIDRGKNKFR